MMSRTRLTSIRNWVAMKNSMASSGSCSSMTWVYSSTLCQIIWRPRARIPGGWTCWKMVLDRRSRRTLMSIGNPPSRSLENRVLLPILGRPYAQALEGRELRLTYGRSGFFLNYFDFTLPIATRSYGRLLGYRQDRLERVVGSNVPTWLEFQGILAAIAQIPSPGSTPAEAPGERRQHREAVKERFWSLYTGSPEVKRFVDGN